MPIEVAAWIDVNTGHLVETSIHCDNEPGGRSIMGKVQRYSNARNTSLRNTDERGGWNNPAGASSRQSVSDRAFLTFATVNGGMVKLVIPAPDAAIFLGDGETVNPAAIADLIGEVVVHGVSPGGITIAGYAYGNLVKSNDRVQ